MSLIKEIVTYSSQPFFTTERDRFTPEHLIKLTVLTTGLALLIIISVSVLFYVLGIDFPKQSDVFEETPQIQLMFFAVILAPLIEETVFRSWMGAHNGLRVALPIIAAIFVFIVFIGASSAIAFLALLILTAILAFYFSVIYPRLSDDKLDANFKYYFWFSGIIFGLIHLGNYEPDVINPALVLLVLPQTIAGFVFGYARMRFGVLACMLTHGFYNGTIFLLVNLLK